MKKYLQIILLLVLTSILSSCMYDYGETELDEYGNGLEYGYQTILGDAYAGPYKWDGTEDGQTFAIMNEYKGCKVTMLGGYAGRGYPRPFYVLFPDEYSPYEKSIDYLSDVTKLEDDETLTIEIIPFYITLGKNVEELHNLYSEVVYLKQNEDGIDVYYIPKFYFYVDEDNKTYYTEDGKLYRSSNDSLVVDFLYYDN